MNYSILMPGAVVESGAVVEYAIIGENTIVRAGARVGASPSGREDWGVATCGPDIVIAADSVVEPGAILYESTEVAKG